MAAVAEATADTPIYAVGNEVEIANDGPMLSPALLDANWIRATVTEVSRLDAFGGTFWNYKYAGPGIYSFNSWNHVRKATAPVGQQQV